MVEVAQELWGLQRLVAKYSAGPRDEDADRVYYSEAAGGFDVSCFLDPYGDAYPEVLAKLAHPAIAPAIRSLALRGPDEGCNGTRNWNLAPLAEGDGIFSQMTHFYVEPTAPEHHNQSIVGEDYDEDGQLGRILARAPVLRQLTAPSAPDASFFQVGERPLISLRLDAGYDHQGFIANLAETDCYPELAVLDWGEAVGEEEGVAIPVEQYAALFRSRVFDSVRVFRLRNARLTGDERRGLRALRPELQFMTIQTRAEYVR